MIPNNGLCNKGRFSNNSEIDTLISKRLYVENKAKLSQLERKNQVKNISVLFHLPPSRVLFLTGTEVGPGPGLVNA